MARRGPERGPAARRGNGPVRVRLTPEADAIQRSAFQHAIRLGHPYLGSEHTLLALAGARHPVGTAMREHGVTPDRVEEQITRLSGGGLFGDLDRDALASLGIDVEAVSDRVTRALGPEALHRASQAAFREHRVRWWDPRRVRVAGSRRDGFLPIPPGSGFAQCMKHARIEGQVRHDSQIGVQHLALGLLTVTTGLAPAVLAALDVSVPELRAAIAGPRL